MRYQSDLIGSTENFEIYAWGEYYDKISIYIVKTDTTLFFNENIGKLEDIDNITNDYIDVFIKTHKIIAKH